MTQDERRQLYAAIHVALDWLEHVDVDPTPIAGVVASVDGQYARRMVAAAGWAAEPLDEATLTARLAALAREAAGCSTMEVRRVEMFATGDDDGWRVVDPGEPEGVIGTWRDSAASAWLSVLEALTERFERARARRVADAPAEDGWARRQG